MDPRGPSLAYRWGPNLYVNLTNRCPTSCVFCVKAAWSMRYRGYELHLGGREPSAADLAAVVERELAAAPFDELVFCGYGESTYRLPELKELVSRFGDGAFRLRLNTVGLGDLIWGRPIAAELRGLDSVSVSLNSADPAQWLELHRPAPPYRERGFESVLGFIEACVRELPETVVTAVDLPAVDWRAVARLARRLGAGFRLRPLLEASEAGSAPAPA